ncbi:MAG: YHS domain-containing protein [Desulfobacteraceae bacterium]|nr:MAG: YHS domain-containing protein [Desulfobacteraceae bacterium]
MLNPSLKMKKRCLTGVLMLAWLTIATAPGIALDNINKSNHGVAIKGYDPVAYHTEGRPVKGKKEYSSKWNDAEWYFANEENRNMFAGNPERYAPQYGGYCARSLSTTGRPAGVDPETFRIIDGKLYLNWDAEAADRFEARAAENIKIADLNWEKLTRKR